MNGNLFAQMFTFDQSFQVYQKEDFVLVCILPYAFYDWTKASMIILRTSHMFAIIINCRSKCSMLFIC